MQGPGGKRSRAEINVTPLVDVVLVLLIIFMVLSPAAIAHLPNALPRAAIDSSAVLTADQLVLQLRHGGEALFNRQRVTQAQLRERLRDVLRERSSRTVFFDVADDVPYGEAVQWMSVARQAGATALALALEEGSREASP